MCVQYCSKLSSVKSIDFVTPLSTFGAVVLMHSQYDMSSSSPFNDAPHSSLEHTTHGDLFVYVLQFDRRRAALDSDED